MYFCPHFYTLRRDSASFLPRFPWHALRERQLMLAVLGWSLFGFGACGPITSRLSIMGGGQGLRSRKSHPHCGCESVGIVRVGRHPGGDVDGAVWFVTCRPRRGLAKSRPTLVCSPGVLLIAGTLVMTVVGEKVAKNYPQMKARWSASTWDGVPWDVRVIWQDKRSCFAVTCCSRWPR